MNGVYRTAAAVYIAVISYLIINLFLGNGGITAYGELKNYRDKISANITELEAINKSLKADSERLINDSDEISVLARELNWYKSNEGIIVVNGYKNNNSGYSMGRLMSRELKEKRSDNTYRLISVLIAVCFYLSAGFLSVRGRKTRI